MAIAVTVLFSFGRLIAEEKNKKKLYQKRHKYFWIQQYNVKGYLYGKEIGKKERNCMSYITFSSSLRENMLHDYELNEAVNE